MRIVGGTLKGRIFHPGKSFKARPTTDFAKENLFNILENRIEWNLTEALDLFSGTGSISYELISRGCHKVTAVETNFRHIKFIADVKQTLNLENLIIIRQDVFAYLAKAPCHYDLVFADPPFDLHNFGKIPELVLNSGIVKTDGIFILEHNKFHLFDKEPGFTERRSYGSVNFSFFRVPGLPAK